ncbi:MAG TPA: hypothetical protein VNI54_08385 [Thermoanaerobaculia bacterium]|nr:hypothetical protein [Thermoanaerobaculia bacterium]
MRTFIITLCIVAVLVLGVVVYLVVTTPDAAPPIRFPLTAAQQDLLRHVPADAEAYALVPAPAVLLAKLKANPITSEPVTRWTDEHALPPASMLGRADAVAWRSGKTTAYAVRFDPIRALIARAWSMFTPVETAWHGRVLVINGSSVPSRPPEELALANGLPEGDALVVQRKESRGAYPPIGRPAVSSLRVRGKEIEIASRARSNEMDRLKPVLRAELPRGAMLSVSFAEPPRLLGDLERLVAADVDALIGDGGLLAIYDVDSGTFLPRPHAAIVVPVTDHSRAVLARYDTLVSLGGEVRESGGQFVIGLHRDAARQYAVDTKSPLPWPANRWALRMDPVRLIPVLRKIGDNPALRFATPRIHRGARDLRRWMGALEQAREVEAAASVTDGVEELRVRVASK